MSNEISNSERRVVAWIGKAVRVEGKVTSEEDLTIDGDVEGSIGLGGHSRAVDKLHLRATVMGRVRAG